MKITGKFSLKGRVDPKEAVEFLNDVIKELAADPANGLTIDIDAANRDEAKAKVKWLLTNVQILQVLDAQI
jgi:anti-anti-sigma regulatory factor